MLNKIIKPLKNILKISKPFRSILAYMMFVTRSLGLRNTIVKTIQLCRRDGWQAIIKRFHFILLSRSLPAVIIENGECVDRNDYTEWIHRYDTMTDDFRNRMRKKIETYQHQPLISVIMPTYNPKLLWLKEAINSVMNQIYQNWELCIADDASTIDTIVPILEEYAKQDRRIKVFFRNENGHISAASNSALKIAAGEYVALLDQDDLLSEHALFWIVDTINSNPDVQMIYSDEDKTNRNGKRFDPYFKCEWNPDLFYSHNLVCHLGVYKTGLLSDVGAFRIGFEGAQDYDLTLRCIERIKEHEIAHIPRILYHWRQHTESTSSISEAKPYALKAGKKALNEHFARIGVKCNVELLDFGMYRTRYTIDEKMPLVSLIIPTRNGLHFIQRCIESILKKTIYSNYEIIIIDNGSDDAKTLSYFRELKKNRRIYIIRDERSFNYSALNNVAVKLARGEFVCLLNNDIEVISKEWLSEMVSLALQPKVGAVGARLWYPKEELQHGGLITGIGGAAGTSHKYLRRGLPGYFCRANIIQGMSAVTGACLLIKKGIYEEVGGLNETDLQIALNDVDFCLRVKEAGYRNIWTPYAELYHHESATRGYENDSEKQARFLREKEYLKNRWGDKLINDPAYSPNLTLDHEDFSLSWPPRVDLSV